MSQARPRAAIQMFAGSGMTTSLWKSESLWHGLQSAVYSMKKPSVIKMTTAEKSKETVADPANLGF